MSQFYIQGPKNVPQGFTKPTSSFQKKVIIATISLFAFVAIYSALMVWFAILSFRLFEAVFNDMAENSLFNIVAGICLAFLSFFMLKSLFIFQKNDGSMGKEVTPESEPELINFLNKIADEAEAPRPHKVFLTSRVNASVYYDLNIFNLIFPTKKNLEIGLGLINVLSLGELKAVLAHEFGHFAQRSMLLGRYVYTAQQIAYRVINKRDALDNILAGLSRIDLRIAWIGWILSILVWAIRSLIQTLFSVVAIAERALSREMEFQADLVAVSLTGSDALINALHRLRVADEAYHVAVSALEDQLADKKAVEDMFALQSNYIEKMRWILNDPNYGQSPEIINKDGSNRVFNKGIVNPPEMWSTHPADNDREANAKQTYIYADIDDRSSWVLFADSEAIRKEITKELISTAKVDTTIISSQESVEKMNQNDYNWSFLNPRYKGAYLSRFSMLNFKDVEDAYDGEIDIDFKRTFDAIYTDELSDIIDQHKEIKEEITALDAVQYEVMTAENRKIMHRGNEIKRKDIPELLEQCRNEEQTIRARLMHHDQQARKVHYEVAMSSNPTLAPYLKKVASLVHYAEHGIRNLEDMYGKFNNTLMVIMADGKVTSAEMQRLLGDCNELHKVLNSIYSSRESIQLDKVIEEKLGKAYSELLEPFGLGLPNSDPESMNRWIDAARSWINAGRFALISLRNASLERLLNVEDQLRESHLNSKSVIVETAPLEAPQDYPTILPGDERELQFKLTMWDRFVIGDGIVPTAAKFSVSAILIIGALYLGNINTIREAIVFNGLDASVKVEVNGDAVYLEPNETEEIEIFYGLDNDIITTTEEGDTIEQFKAKAKKGFTYVYNVASAALAYQYKVQYTVSDFYDGDDEMPTYYGAKRWYAVKSDYIMEEAPESIRTNYNTTKTVFDIESEVDPYTLVELVEDETQRYNMVKAHVLYDDQASAGISPWISIAVQLDESLGLISKRLDRFPKDVLSWREIQERVNASKKDSICNLMDQLYEEDQSNANMYYLKVRCMEDSKEQDNLFITGHEQWPDNPWLAYASAYVYAHQENWDKAYHNYGLALQNQSQLIEGSGLNLERIHRLMKNEGKESDEYEDLLNNSDEIAYARQLENGLIGEYDGDSYYACYLVSQGELAKAIEFSTQNPASEAYFHWYIASSWGASREMISQVMEYSTEDGINSNTIWFAIALRQKEHKSIEAFTDKLNDFGIDDETVQLTKSFLSYVKQKRLSEAQQVLDQFNYYHVRIIHQMMAVIILEEQAPARWKKQAQTMLLVYERPFMGIKTDV